MQLKPGSRWKSVACKSEVVVVRPPKTEVSLECGGHPMSPVGGAAGEAQPLATDRSSGTTVGKRYFDEASGIEVLGSKAGEGSLSVDGRALQLKEAKALPASD